jgi:hypothetical protein
MKLPLVLMVVVTVYIHIWIWIWIRTPRVTDPDLAKIPDPCGSGSTTLKIYCCNDYVFYWIGQLQRTAGDT